MRTYRQTLLDDLTTLVTFLTGEARVHSYHCVPSSLSLFTQDVEECAPTGVHDALGQGVVLGHVENVKLLNSNHLVLFGVLFGRFEMEITALARDLEMGLRRATSSLAASMAAFLASAQLALLASQGSLRGAIEARVFYGVALTIRQKGLEANVNADVRMLTRGWFMLGRWLHLTHDEGVPMPIRTMDQVNRLGCALNGPMQLDLEEVSELLGHNKMFLILMQIAIFAVLSQLNGVPAVWHFETRETSIRNAQLFGIEKALERFGEPISQHLYRGCRDIFPATSLELCRQLVLGGEGAPLCILPFRDLKHLIIELARRDQATHEQMGLFFIWIQAVFKRSHTGILLHLIRLVKHVPPAGGRRFTPMSEARGTHAAFLVAQQQGGAA